MFTFLNAAMTTATKRFLNYALGQNDTEQARNVYSISFIIHILIALLVVILAETIGLWFFYNLLNIPPDRQTAAFFVYQLSIIATVINILHVPYHATIIAYEKMSFFALLSIIESILKLGIVFLLPIIFFDILIVYAFLVCITGIAVFFIYKIYCNKTFEIAHFRYSKDKKLFWQLAGFSGWSIFGGFANVSRNHGINVLVNIFHGVTVNAAMGIAMQVNPAVYQFVSNFQTAFNPQIIKSYVAKNYDYFMRLLFQTSKASFFLLFFFVLPLYLNADFVLQLWLKNVPEYTVVFTRIILLVSLLEAISGPLWMSIQATGNIKKFQLIASCFTFANVPLSLMFLWLGFNPIWVLIIKVGLNILELCRRIFFVSRVFNFSVIDFLRRVIAPILIITGVSSVVTVFTSSFFVDWTKLILSCVVSTLCIGFLIYWTLTTDEKCLIKKLINKKVFNKSYKNGN